MGNEHIQSLPDAEKVELVRELLASMDKIIEEHTKMIPYMTALYIINLH